MLKIKNYVSEVFDSLVENLAQYEPLCLLSATGSGKTTAVTFSHLNGALKNKTVVVLCPTRQLTDDFQTDIESKGGNSVKIYGGHTLPEVEEEINHARNSKGGCIIVVCYDQIKRDIINLLISSVDLVIVDEVDTIFTEKSYRGETMKLLIELLLHPPKFCLCITATMPKVVRKFNDRYKINGRKLFPKIIDIHATNKAVQDVIVHECTSPDIQVGQHLISNAVESGSGFVLAFLDSSSGLKKLSEYFKRKYSNFAIKILTSNSKTRVADIDTSKPTIVLATRCIRMGVSFTTPQKATTVFIAPTSSYIQSVEGIVQSIARVRQSGGHSVYVALRRRKEVYKFNWYTTELNMRAARSEVEELNTVGSFSDMEETVRGAMFKSAAHVVTMNNQREIDYSHVISEAMSRFDKSLDVQAIANGLNEYYYLNASLQVDNDLLGSRGSIEKRSEIIYEALRTPNEFLASVYSSTLDKKSKQALEQLGIKEYKDFDCDLTETERAKVLKKIVSLTKYTHSPFTAISALLDYKLMSRDNYATYTNLAKVNKVLSGECSDVSKKDGRRLKAIMRYLKSPEGAQYLSPPKGKKHMSERVKKAKASELAKVLPQVVRGTYSFTVNECKQMIDVLLIKQKEQTND
jgi:hypothetical protein